MSAVSREAEKWVKRELVDIATAVCGQEWADKCDVKTSKSQLGYRLQQVTSSYGQAYYPEQYKSTALYERETSLHC